LFITLELNLSMCDLPAALARAWKLGLVRLQSNGHGSGSFDLLAICVLLLFFFRIKELVENKETSPH
jgi:hypothetical protein